MAVTHASIQLAQPTKAKSMYTETSYLTSGNLKSWNGHPHWHSLADTANVRHYPPHNRASPIAGRTPHTRTTLLPQVYFHIQSLQLDGQPESERGQDMYVKAPRLHYSQKLRYYTKLQTL